MSISDEVVIMNNGPIIQYGSSEDIYNNPNSLFIAKFIGKSNWINEKEFFRPQDASLYRTNESDLCFETVINDKQFLGENWDYLLSFKEREWNYHSCLNQSSRNEILNIYVNKDDIKVI